MKGTWGDMDNICWRSPKGRVLERYIEDRFLDKQERGFGGKKNVGRILEQTHGGDIPGDPLEKTLLSRHTVSVLKGVLGDIQRAWLQG